MTLRTFQDGEIIYREGDPSVAAYQVVEGVVVLFRAGQGAPVSEIQAGGMFGDLGVLDKSPRATSARARGMAKVEVTDRETFLTHLASDGGLAQTVMGRLVKRLRNGPSPFTQALDSPPLLDPGEDPQGLVGGLRRLGRYFGLQVEGQDSLPLLPTADARPMTGGVVVLLADLEGDDAERTLRTALTEALSNRKNVVVRPVDASIPVSGAGPLATQLAMAQEKGRQWLDAAKADLLVFGHANDGGRSLSLRFLPAEPENRHGGFALADHLDLPVELEGAMGDLFVAVTLGAVVPRNDPQRQTLSEGLNEALRKAQRAVRRPPNALNATEKAMVQLCMANTYAVSGHGDPGHANLDTALETYNTALTTLTPEQAPVEWATLYKHKAEVLQYMARRGPDQRGRGGRQPNELLDEAAQCYRHALEVFTAEHYPMDWGSLQLSLAGMQNRRGVKSEDVGLLKEAVYAYQAALRAYDRATYPQMYGEVNHSLGKLLQFIALLLESPQLLQEAAEACRRALQVRTQRNAPLSWAASQVNLGTALVQLARHTRETEPVAEAREAFVQAMAVYEARGARKMMDLVRTNLTHANRLQQNLLPGPGEADGTRLPPPGEAPDDPSNWWRLGDDVTEQAVEWATSDAADAEADSERPRGRTPQADPDEPRFFSTPDLKPTGAAPGKSDRNSRVEETEDSVDIGAKPALKGVPELVVGPEQRPSGTKTRKPQPSGDKKTPTRSKSRTGGFKLSLGGGKSNKAAKPVKKSGPAKKGSGPRVTVNTPNGETQEIKPFVSSRRGRSADNN